MRIFRNIKPLQIFLEASRKAGKTIGFVPTMGAFHEGHLSLIRKAKKNHDICVVSIYVNPKQFGPNEDWKKYPRNFNVDSSLLKKENIDICFFASDNEIYPEGYLTFVNVDKISNVLCGAFRPGHFQGVATIVAKLLNIVGPCTMYLGAKDAQQVVVLKTMVRDLNFPVKIIVGATVRATDGLALSSRNAFLSAAQRKQAVVLYQALREAVNQIADGERDIDLIKRTIRKKINQAPESNIQYIACVDKETLQPLKKLSGEVLVAGAVYFGKTRLIDNVTCNIHEPKKNKN